MKIYIASKYESAPRIRLEARKLMDKGHRIIGTWLMEQHTREQAWQDEKYCRLTAKRDLEEVADADLLLLDTFDKSETGGREVELGVMLAKRAALARNHEWGGGPAVWRVGPWRNIFHLAVDKAFSDWDAVHEVIEEAYGTAYYEEVK